MATTYHDSLEDLCGDRGKDSLVIVNAHVGVDVWKFFFYWTKQDTQSNVHILEICGKGEGFMVGCVYWGGGGKLGEWKCFMRGVV